MKWKWAFEELCGFLFSLTIFIGILSFFSRNHIDFDPWFFVTILCSLVLVTLLMWLFTSEAIYRFWNGMKTFGIVITNIFNFILLLPVYFLGVGVSFIIAKIFRMDLLHAKLKGTTYWQDYDLGTQEEEEYFKMY